MQTQSPLPPERVTLVPMDQDIPGVATLAVLKNWTRNFLMRDNPELGRTGNVCPFTSFGARLDTLRFGVSDAGVGEEAKIRAQLRDALDQFDAIPYPKEMGAYRAILIAFPRCSDSDGTETMKRAQQNMRFTGFLRARMLGVFHDAADEAGLWNKDFRPLRAPLPIIAIRSLVAADAAFVLRHPVLAPAYLFNYPFAGPRELAKVAMRKA
jgi:hypothetical protein